MNIITRTDKSATTINLFFELFVNFSKKFLKRWYISFFESQKMILTFD